MEFLPLANGMDSHTQHKNSPSRGPTVAEAGVPPPESQGGYPKLRCWPQALVYSQVPVGDKPRRSLNRGGLYGAFVQIKDVWHPASSNPPAAIAPTASAYSAPVSRFGIYGRTSKLPVHLLMVICDQWPLI